MTPVRSDSSTFPADQTTPLDIAIPLPCAGGEHLKLMREETPCGDGSVALSIHEDLGDDPSFLDTVEADDRSSFEVTGSDDLDQVDTYRSPSLAV